MCDAPIGITPNTDDVEFWYGTCPLPGTRPQSFGSRERHGNGERPSHQLSRPRETPCRRCREDNAASSSWQATGPGYTGTQPYLSVGTPGVIDCMRH